MRRFQCPECGGQVEVAEDNRARRTECPSCKEVVLIPSWRKKDAERVESEPLEEPSLDLLPWLGYGLTPTSLTCVPDWADDEDCS